MTLAEPVLQLNPSETSTKESTVHCHREGVSPWRSSPLSGIYDSLDKTYFLTSNQLGSRRDRRRIATRSATARNDRGVLARGLAFTMAEILLSLTIIGVVAAITLPSLTGNINERTWNTQRKALYARFSQALPLMDALNGFGTFTEGNSSTSAIDTAAETFITGGLSKVLKINNICDNEHLEDCGIAASITTLAGSRIVTPTTLEELNSNMVGSGGGHNSYSIYKTKAAAFETQNGESIVVYYNPTCIGSLDEKPFTDSSVGGVMYIQQRICANFIYDLNGNKGPNTVGKDIGFMTVMYPFDAQLYAPFPAPKPLSGSYEINFSTGSGLSPATRACTDYDSEYRLPRADELAAMFVNAKLISASNYALAESYGYASSDVWTKIDGSKVGVSQSLENGARDDRGSITWNANVWCVKR